MKRWEVVLVCYRSQFVEAATEDEAVANAFGDLKEDKDFDKLFEVNEVQDLGE